ncbi:hypothetical protein, partial [Sphingobacterium mizutaii]
RDDLLKDIPDNKAFFSCESGRAKSHLKWAEGFWLLLGSKSNKESIVVYLRNAIIMSATNDLFFSSRRIANSRKRFHPR